MDLAGGSVWVMRSRLNRLLNIRVFVARVAVAMNNPVFFGHFIN